VQFEAITWERMAGALAGHLDARPGDGWTRLGIDGAPAADPAALAALTAEALRLRGRSVLLVAAEGFLRPASVRLEYGREDVESYLHGWYDTAALWREVFGPLGRAATAGSCPTCGTR
jgi:hypothetical protein